MVQRFLLLAIAAILAAGCNDRTSPRDVTPPAAPRGLVSVTGDRQVRLRWLANTEPDVAGYRVYRAPCARGGDCPYTQVGSTTGTSFVVTGLANGVTRYFAVAAYDRVGNESDLSYEDIFDTPRPEGFGLALTNVADDPARSGYDFSDFVVRPSNDSRTDIYFGYDGSTYHMVAAFTDTDIQGAGWASSLDAVDYAPNAGWSPTGTVELIVGHCYLVWTHDDHYAKFRVTSLSPARVVLDWAYQVDRGNRELRSGRASAGAARVPRALAWDERGLPRR